MPRPVHFEIHATNPDETKTFYENVFGWQIDRWGDAPYWIITTGTGPGIDGGLVPRQGPRPADNAPVGTYVITIDVPDLDIAVKDITASGGTIAVAKQPVPTVGWLAYVKDPDGNLFGIMQPDESAR